LCPGRFLLTAVKKIVTIILAAQYLVLSAGLVVHFHFCCGKLAEVSVLKAHDRCCLYEWPAQDAYQKKCCTFEDERYQVSEDQRTPLLQQADVRKGELHTAGSTPYLSAAPSHEPRFRPAEDPPPPVRRYALLSQFVFYG
jgi:hypothetical protein